jgi:hypothetical protein
LPDHDAGGIVNVQDSESGSAAASFANENGTLPTKVTFPGLSARMEQRHDFAVEKACQVRPLGAIAFPTGKTEVLEIIAAAMLTGNDMFHMEGEEIKIVLVHPAIFTTVSRPLPNQGPRRGIDHHAPEERASSCRALAFKRATNVPKET